MQVSELIDQGMVNRIQSMLALLNPDVVTGNIDATLWCQPNGMYPAVAALRCTDKDGNPCRMTGIQAMRGLYLHRIPAL